MRLEDLAVYYSAKLIPGESGLYVFFEEFVCVRETEHVAFCIKKSDFYNFIGYVRTHKMSVDQAAKKVGLKRIYKDSSRFAFSSKEKALAQLIYLKKRQIRHMERDLNFLSVFVEKVNSVDDLKPDFTYSSGQDFIVPETEDLVRRYFVFN